MRRVMADAGDGLSFGEALLSQPSETPRQPAPADIGPVLVTGASGFVGSAVAAAFRAAGYPVRALVRASSPRTNLRIRRRGRRVGDLPRPRLVAAALKGMRYLVHAAADYRLWAPDPEEIVRTNVEGTRIVMEEALPRRRRADRLHQQRRDLRRCATAPPADETRAARPGRGDRRLQAQQGRSPSGWSRRWSARDGLPAVIVNPSTPIGPRDVQADADRPHHHRSRLGPDAGLHRHRPELRPRRRRGGRASRGAASAGGSASATSWAARTCSSSRCWRTSPASSGGAPPPVAPAPHPALSDRVRRRSCWRALTRQRAVRHRGWPAHGAVNTCFSTTPRRGANSATRRGPISEGLADAIDWFKAAGYLR